MYTFPSFFAASPRDFTAALHGLHGSTTGVQTHGSTGTTGAKEATEAKGVAGGSGVSGGSESAEATSLGAGRARLCHAALSALSCTGMFLLRRRSRRLGGGGAANMLYKPRRGSENKLFGHDTDERDMYTYMYIYICPAIYIYIYIYGGARYDTAHHQTVG